MIIRSDTENLEALEHQVRHWAYNALDSALTYEIRQVLSPDLIAQNTYDFTRAMQGPALEMMLRGIKVDLALRSELINETKEKLAHCEAILETFAIAVWGRPLNPASPKQVAEFFFTCMGLPATKKWNPRKGERTVSTDRASLEKLQNYIHARPIINTILTCKDLQKTLQVLQKGVDHDGRIRTSYNIVGTETGRWSASTNAFGTGDNLQNWTDRLRQILVADSGMKFAYIDLEQAESRAVAYISGDEAYIQACESGDLHTTTAKMVWPHIKTRADADQIFYREFSYRDMSKRGGHGTNYYGTPITMASHLKVPTQVMEQFQQKYFMVFSGIPAWHNRVRRDLQTTGQITTAFGRRRQFLGRRTDDATLREAIAYDPQSTIGDLLNLGLLRVWQSRLVICMAQLHDAILIMYPEEQEDEVLPKVLALMTIPVQVHGRTMVVPCEAAVGWNWRKWSKDNPDGLKKWKEHDSRTRSRSPNTSLLDSRIC